MTLGRTSSRRAPYRRQTPAHVPTSRRSRAQERGQSTSGQDSRGLLPKIRPVEAKGSKGSVWWARHRCSHTWYSQILIVRQQTRNVLLADGTPSDLMAFELLLRQAGFEVTTASSAAEALEQAREDPPDIAILDSHLGNGPDGLNVARTLAAWPRRPLIIVISAWAGEFNRAAALASCADRFLPKPVNPHLLLTVVSTGNRSHLKVVHSTADSSGGGSTGAGGHQHSDVSDG
jgi:CheY-like chemotaxis protein